VLRILHVCHGVLYKQLCAWMIHGLVHDPHREFFIQKVPGSSILPSLPKLQEEEGELGIMGVTGRQMQAMVTVQLLHISYDCYKHEGGRC
jgi:gamma-tubulin complex component 4